MMSEKSKKNELDQEKMQKISGGRGDDGSTIPPANFNVHPASGRKRQRHKPTN